MNTFHQMYSEIKVDEENLLSDMMLFALYCELTNSVDVSEFTLKIKNYGINIPLFVAFGVYKKILRRVHIYAFCKGKDSLEERSTKYDFMIIYDNIP